MDDLHFLERLERIGGGELDRALALYRNPDLVRLVLERAAAPDVARIAIALADRPPGETPGPWIVVARNGHFVTCLARGMRHDLPVVSRATLERLAERYEEARALDAYATELAGDRATARLWGRLVRGGARVSRAQFAAIQPLAPLYVLPIIDKGLFMALELAKAMKANRDRLVTREGRLTSRDYEILDAMWSTLWWLCHAYALLASCPHEQVGDLLGAEAVGSALCDLTRVAVCEIPFTPLVARTMRFMAAVGKPALPHLKRQLTKHARDYPDVAAAALHMAAIGVARPKLAAEITKALYLPSAAPGTIDMPGAWHRRHAVEWLETESARPPQTPEEARVDMIVRSVRSVQQREPTEAERAGFAAIAMTEYGRMAAAHLGAAAVNMESLIWRKRRWVERLTAQGRFVACADPAELYLEDPTVAPLPAGDGTHRMITNVLAPMRAWIAEGNTQPRVPEVGRNAPCPCGSGRKHKRCCGA